MLPTRGAVLVSRDANNGVNKVANNKRRAFRDVTNASNNVNEAKSSLAGGKKTIQSHANRSKQRGVAVRAPLRPVNQNVLKPDQPKHGSKALLTSASTDPILTSYQHTGQVDNIDERDINDPLCAAEYVKGMYDHFREREVFTSVKPIYMMNQPHINEKMRGILTDWLVDVHLKFKLVPETLYLTVNLIDRYLERAEVSRPKLQLVGVTCLLIASKYEEIYPPELRDLVYICDRAYTKKEILDMEETVLKKLHYQVTIPSAHAFLVRYLKAGHADKKMVQLSCYILDGTLQSYRLLEFLPSQLAAAAVFIARKCIGRNSWSPTLLAYAGYREEDILPVAQTVLKEKRNVANELPAVEKKYSNSRYGNVAATDLQVDL